eukprot:gene23356-30266_t
MAFFYSIVHYDLSRKNLNSSEEIGFPVSIEDLLSKKFDESIKNNNVLLFKSFSNYKRSLPTRKYISEHIPLYTFLPYYVREESLRDCAENLMRFPEVRGNLIRTVVRYIAVPSGSGKTACVLPVFLRTALTQYIYISFTNNNFQNFELFSENSISNNPKKAAQQGAAFMFQCIKSRLESLSGPHRIELTESPPGIAETKGALRLYLVETLGPGHKCLFHLDEHRQAYLESTPAKIFPVGRWSCWQRPLSPAHEYAHIQHRGCDAAGDLEAHAGLEDKGAGCLHRRRLNDHSETFLTSFESGLISASLRSLLNSKEPEIRVYETGKYLFIAMLKRSDIIDSTPLETAYMWVLSTKSAIAGDLTFLFRPFTFKCKQIQARRLFPINNTSIVDTSILRENVLYHAMERNGLGTHHPLADLFFITGNKELVLVDISAGNELNVQMKMMNMLKWIEGNGGLANSYNFCGVIVAPNINHHASESRRVMNTLDSVVEVVRGSDARNLLGGLNQIFEWYDLEAKQKNSALSPIISAGGLRTNFTLSDILKSQGWPVGGIHVMLHRMQMKEL